MVFDKRSIFRLLADLGLHNRMEYKGQDSKTGAHIYLSSDRDWKRYANRKVRQARYNKWCSKVYDSTRKIIRGLKRDPRKD